VCFFPLIPHQVMRPRSAPTLTCRDPGHEEETFKPEIFSRSSSYKAPRPVHERLYESGMAKTTKAHNEVGKGPTTQTDRHAFHSRAVGFRRGP
jgi:hypothetical protein